MRIKLKDHYPIDPQTNEDKQSNRLAFIGEVKQTTALKKLVIKQQVAIKYNKRVLCDFEENDLILRENLKNNNKGKLSLNWEGPYWINAKTEKGAYILETLSNELVPWT